MGEAISYAYFLLFSIVSPYFFDINLITQDMSYIEQMSEWLKKNPNATIEDAWKAGYFQSNENWCKGKVDLLEKAVDIMKKIIE